MKKVVYESYQEFQDADIKGRKVINENMFNKVRDTLSRAVEKIGNFLVVMFGGKPIFGAVLPTNVGVMVQKGTIHSKVAFIPNQSDLAIEPSLSSQTEAVLLQKFGKGVNENVNEARVALDHPDPNVPNVGVAQFQRRIRMAMQDPLNAKPLVAWGAPGIGKTKIVEQVLTAKGEGRLIAVPTATMAPDDFTLPGISKVDSDKFGVQFEATDVPKSWLPCYIPTGDAEEDKRRNDIANGDGGGILFFDELSRASASVQNACLKIIDERIIGHAKIGDAWTIIAASNRADDDPDSQQNFSTALGNRFSQINFVPNFKEWKNWAEGSGKIDPRIIDFLEFNQEYFYTLDTDEEKSVFASPRSWQAASKNLAALMQDSKEQGYKVSKTDVSEIVGSDVGQDIAAELSVFMSLMEQYDPKEIKFVYTDPGKAPMPRKKGGNYDMSESNALLSLIVTATRNKTLEPSEFENFNRYLVRLDHPSLATKAIKMMFEIHPYLHEELGEREGRDKYKKGLDIFIEKYEDIF